MIDVVNKVKVYEIDGEDTEMVETPTIEVRSHWNDPDRVVLAIGRKKWTILAKDLEAAVSNATHTVRF